MVNFTILAGGFSTFVATYVFNNDTSTLNLTKQTTTGDDPSWIASHPQNTSILYAVNEISPVGNLQSFLVDGDGGITLVDTVTTGGSGPTFTNPLSTGEVTAMNFGSPNCSLVATVPGDPLHFQTDSPAVSFPVNGGPSNPHMSLEFGDEVFVSDLGADKIWRLARDGPPGNFKVQGQIDQDAGSGPRHMAIRDNILFIIHEKTSTLTAQLIPAAPNGTTYPLLANVSIIPASAASLNASFAGAEILISEPTDAFPDPLIYVSNRNLGPQFDPQGDTIAIFQFVNSTAGSSDNSTSVSGADNSTDAGVERDSSARRRRAHARAFRLEARDDSDADTSSSSSDDSSTNTPPRNGTLVLQAQIPTGFTNIRGMALGRVVDGSDEFLIAGANEQGGVAIFRRTGGGRSLELVARNTDVPSRTSFVFV